MSGPLEGIRVLDLSQGAAGPTCAMLLGDLGAEIVKVEPPGGEWGRRLGPPFVAGVAAAFLGMNRNKRSIVADVKNPAGREAIVRLAAACDVALESFRPGVADRLGIGFEVMSARNPRLIYAAISAFGQDGPWRDRPGVDGVVQAMSGIMSVTGIEDGPPVKVGVPAADMAGGFFAAQAILAALFARERTGRGQRADVSLLDALLAFQVVPLSMFFASGEPPRRQGSAAPYACPNEAFPTADGYVQVAAYTPDRWHRFCGVIGRAGLTTHLDFATNEARVLNRDALRVVLTPIFQERTTGEWLALLDAADILCAPLLSYPELVAEPHVAHTRMLVAAEHPEIGEITAVGNPVRLSATPGAPRRPPPVQPGEHTEEILRDFGFTADEIGALFEQQAVQGVRSPQPAVT